MYLLKPKHRLTNLAYEKYGTTKMQNFYELNEKIRNFNWNDVINDTFSADEACNNFTEVYVNPCESCIPRKQVVVRPSDRPWFTSEFRHNIRIRDYDAKSSNRISNGTLNVLKRKGIKVKYEKVC